MSQVEETDSFDWYLESRGRTTSILRTTIDKLHLAVEITCLIFVLHVAVPETHLIKSFFHSLHLPDQNLWSFIPSQLRHHPALILFLSSLARTKAAFLATSGQHSLFHHTVISDESIGSVFAASHY